MEKSTPSEKMPICARLFNVVLDDSNHKPRPDNHSEGSQIRFTRLILADVQKPVISAHSNHASIRRSVRDFSRTEYKIPSIKKGVSIQYCTPQVVVAFHGKPSSWLPNNKRIT